MSGLELKKDYLIPLLVLSPVTVLLSVHCRCEQLQQVKANDLNDDLRRSGQTRSRIHQGLKLYVVAEMFKFDRILHVL